VKAKRGEKHKGKRGQRVSVEQRHAGTCGNRRKTKCGKRGACWDSGIRDASFDGGGRSDPVETVINNRELRMKVK